MQCPHCTIHFHDNWDTGAVLRNGYPQNWAYRTAYCPGCREFTIEIKQQGGEWARVYPIGANRGPVPPQVPVEIGQDYLEACAVLPFSAKASAALSRRCLQTILREQGYDDRDLARQIDALLAEQNPLKAITQSLRDTVDGIRNFGNFSAHPITDVTTLQIIDVEPHEAEWCLETIEEMFRHFYVRPAQAAARKAALDAKLKAAGKPPSK